jgi:6-phosphogluconolactonase (cycloisomerase 2 family)
LSPDGNHVYVSSYTDDAVAVFSRDTTTGALTFVEVQIDENGGVNGLNGAESVAVSPDGKHVYAAGQNDDAVAVFSRNSGTGALTFVEAIVDGTGGADLLNGAESVAVSPDGKNVYAASLDDWAITVFTRNATTGALTFLEAHEDGAAGVDGLQNARSVTVSPAGSHVYAVGQGDDSVAVFSRNAATGALTFVEIVKDGVEGVEGLDDPRSVIISPDGTGAYATSRYDDTVVVFSRNLGTGELTFVEVQKDNTAGVDGLDEAYCTAVSPDGKHLYAVGRFDDAVAAFEIYQEPERPIPTLGTWGMILCMLLLGSVAVRSFRRRKQS